MDLVLLLWQSVYFMVPAYVANMAPVIAKNLNILKRINRPVDRDMKLADGKALFGKHKTYRGLVVAVVGGIIGAYIQMIMNNAPFFRSISIVSYSNPMFLGAVLGAGAIVGDLIKSFFKRRVKIKPGAKFVPFDQMDFIIGAYAFALPFYYGILSWQLFVASLVMSFFLHISVNHVSFYMGIRKVKW